MDKTAFQKSLHPFIPNASILPIFEVLSPFQVKLKITKERSSKHGDYRPPIQNHFHQISVNGTLNRYAFLVTFLHEIAHLLAFHKTSSLRNPHGEIWKNEFRNLLNQHLSLQCFPKELEPSIKKYASNPKASSASDANLFLGLKKFDEKAALTLNDIDEGVSFIFKNRVFRKEKIRRTRVLCTDVSTGKQYLISKIAEVELKE